jgi:hypothetical protein
MSTKLERLSEREGKLAEDIVVYLLQDYLGLDHTQRLAILAGATELLELIKTPPVMSGGT